MHIWINRKPQFAFSGSNITLNIDIECDIETIQGSQCKNNPEVSTHTGESQSKGMLIAGSVLTVFALSILVTVAVVLIKIYSKNRPAVHT